MDVAVGLGIAGFCISLGLAGLKLWETFLRTSKFEAKFDWLDHAGPPILTFVVMNTGFKKDGIREMRLATDDDDDGGWTPFNAIFKQLPLMLDVDEISTRFALQTVPNSTDRGDQELATGRVTKLIIENSRGRRTVVSVPPPPGKEK